MLTGFQWRQGSSVAQGWTARPMQPGPPTHGPTGLTGPSCIFQHLSHEGFLHKPDHADRVPLPAAPSTRWMVSGHDTVGSTTTDPTTTYHEIRQLQPQAEVTRTDEDLRRKTGLDGERGEPFSHSSTSSRVAALELKNTAVIAVRSSKDTCHNLRYQTMHIHSLVPPYTNTTELSSNNLRHQRVLSLLAQPHRTHHRGRSVSSVPQKEFTRFVTKSRKPEIGRSSAFFQGPIVHNFSP